MSVSKEEATQVALLRSAGIPFTPVEATFRGERVVVVAMVTPNEKDQKKLDLTPLAILIPEGWEKDVKPTEDWVQAIEKARKRITIVGQE